MKKYNFIIIPTVLILLFFPLHALPQGGPFHLDYSTYLGGAGSDSGWSIAVDASGSAYICGRTQSYDFPTVSSWQSGENGDFDAFVTRLGISGSNLIFSTYLGGAGNDSGYSIALDSIGSAYICGGTTSDDFPTENPYQASNAGGTDLFIAKISSGGSILDYSSYAGGSGQDQGRGIAVSEGRSYVTGSTSSGNFPTRGAYQPGFSAVDDAYILLLSSSGSVLVYSTYIGGGWKDGGNGVAVDGSNCAFVTGYTLSTNFPTVNSYQPGKVNGVGTYDAFVSKLTSSGSALIYSTYLAGENNDVADGIVLDDSGAPYVTGDTFSNNFPILNPFQSGRAGSYDVFLTKFSPGGSSLVFSTYLGGAGIDSAGAGYDVNANGNGISLDSEKRVYLAGFTTSTDFPICNAYQASHGGGTEDAFVAVFVSSGSGLFYSTYLGGAGADYGYSIAADSEKWGYVTGSTTSDNFPTGNPYQAIRAGGNDSFVAKMKWVTPTPSTTPTPSSTPTPTTTPTTSPTPSMTPTPSVTTTPSVTPTPTASVTPTPADPSNYCHRSAFIKELEGATIHQTWAASTDGWTYYFKPYPDLPDLSMWGYIRDNQNTFIEETDFSGYYKLEVNLKTKSEDWNIHTGDYLTLIHDGGQILNMYLPRIAGSGAGWRIFPDEDGSTYLDARLCELWQAAPTPVPTATPIPTATPVSSCHDPDSTDFSGDGTSDIAIFRPGSGLWSVRAVTRVYFGGADDNPLPGDYDGDRTADCAIFRGASGLWAARGVTRVYFGGSSDEAIPADYDGDGTRDIGIFRPASGLWALRGRTRVYFGSAADLPLPGDYDGDGTKDVGIFRKASGLWAIRAISRLYFGGQNDTATPGDYAGNAAWTSGIFRSSSGLWAIRGITRVYFGGISDAPVPADFQGTGADNIGIFRGSSGLWALRGLTRVYYGASNDIPLTR